MERQRRKRKKQRTADAEPMKIKKVKETVFGMVDVGFVEDAVSRAYDLLNLSIIILNLAVSIALTFEEARAACGGVLLAIEAVTIAFFAIDYVLRVWTADYLYPELSRPRAIVRYVFSISGLVDLVSFLPYYLPAFYPAGTAAFRLFRVMRIFKLFRIGAYSDSFSVIKTVIYKKRQQLLTSMFIILVLMVGSSLCMYGVEHEVQPDVFENALSGLWWAGSALLTVGYGDIYPVTTLGRIMGTLIAFLGIGVVAIPTGIISAGFIEQYREVNGEGDYQTVRIRLLSGDDWVGTGTEELFLPESMSISEVWRNGTQLKKRGNLKLEDGDVLVINVRLTEDDQ